MASQRYKIRGLLFDKDGTLFDFHRTWFPVMQEAALLAAAGKDDFAAVLLERGGYDYSTQRFLPDSLIAAGNTADLASLWCNLGVRMKEPALCRELDRLFVSQGPRHAVPVTVLSTYFRKLQKQGFTAGIATNDSYRAACETAGHFDFQASLAYIAGYDSGHGAKPEPGMALAFCAQTGIPPHEAAMIGDSRHDIETARRAGYGLVVGVLTGAGTRDTLEPFADIVVPDIMALPGLLGY